MQIRKKSTLGNSSKLYLLGSIAWLLFFILINANSYAVHASSNATTSTSPTSFIQSYATSTSLQEGMIVELNKAGSNSVQPASQTNIDNTFGVVVDPNDASIAVENNNKSTNQVYVANSGHYEVLVSDQNGPINAGNYITVSALDGVGMKDNSTEPIVVAQALSSFSNSSPIISTDQVRTTSGNETVHLGLVSANIAIGHNPLLVNPDSGVPRVLASLSQQIAGKTVSPWRIWLGMAMLFVVALIVGSMLYGAVRSSIISIGRNPLSKKAISRGFISVVLAALIILTSTLFGVYLLLKA